MARHKVMEAAWEKAAMLRLRTVLDTYGQADVYATLDPAHLYVRAPDKDGTVPRMAILVARYDEDVATVDVLADLRDCFGDRVPTLAAPVASAGAQPAVAISKERRGGARRHRFSKEVLALSKKISTHFCNVPSAERLMLWWVPDRKCFVLRNAGGKRRMIDPPRGSRPAFVVVREGYCTAALVKPMAEFLWRPMDWVAP